MGRPFYMGQPKRSNRVAILLYTSSRP
ncbi:hypothetical protein LCGC14_0682720, partial [marine sediment metagenome]